jgi:hypothetical protein
MRAQTAKAAGFPSYYREKTRILFFPEKVEEDERIVQTTFVKNNICSHFSEVEKIIQA